MHPGRSWGHYVVALLFLFMSIPGGMARAQCLLANPSFEVTGSGGPLLRSWNQFGQVTTSSHARHGQLAAVAIGPASGDWAVSGFWQAHDATEGESFAVTGHVLHPSARPLLGGCAAIVNIEWRDAGGELIDYESHTVADTETHPDTWQPFSFTSAPAPQGTASTRLLVGVLQGPTDLVPEARFDQLTFTNTTSPTHDQSQWPHFPGGRSLVFAGHTWRVKGPGLFGPGPNFFQDDQDAVWVDAHGRLHLTQGPAGDLHSTEVVNEQALGYGDYVLTTRGRLDTLAAGVVLGFFLWEYDTCWDPGYLWWNPYNEIDIEYSRWDDPASDNAQFVAQPYDQPGNRERFDVPCAPDEILSHAMRWRPESVEYRVWRGPADQEATSPLVYSWTYAGPHVPRPEQPRLHLNLWLFGEAPTEAQEVVLTDFRFTPEGGLSAAPIGAPPGPSRRLKGAFPNPFNPSTTVRLDLAAPAAGTRLDVFDLKGRRLTNLHHGALSSGQHRFEWDGKDYSGRKLASGVYLVVFQENSIVESERVILLK